MMIRLFILIGFLFFTHASYAQDDASISKTSMGVESPSSLIPLNSKIWSLKDKETLIEGINNVPNSVPSRGLGKLLKTMLMMPVPLEKTDGIDTQTDVDDVTAARLQKLIDMGAFDEAKNLVKIIEDHDVKSVNLAKAIANSHIALGNIEAACLDLLSFDSGAQEGIKELDSVYEALIDNCTNDNRPDTKDILRVLTLNDIKTLNPMTLSLALSKSAVKADSQASYNVFKTLSPYAQSSVIRSNTLPDLAKIPFIKHGLSYDLITPSTARKILADTIKDKELMEFDAIIASLDKKRPSTWLTKLERARELDLSDAQRKILTTKLATLAVINSPYDLLSYASRDTNQKFGFDVLNYGAMTDRKSYIMALTQALADIPPVGDGSEIKISESPWIFLVLSRLITPSDANISEWADSNLDMLTPIAPDLARRLSYIFQGFGEKGDKKSNIFMDYVNNNSLTLPRNYVMHRDDVLLYAKKMADDDPLGLLASQLAQVSNSENLDRIDPVIVAEMIDMLKSAGLVETAYDIAIESLAHLTTITDAEMGNKQTKEN